jgi:hypothetical protein
MMIEFGKNGTVSEEQYRENVRSQAEEILTKPVNKWRDWDYYFIESVDPVGLDETLNIAFEMQHREGIGIVAFVARQHGIELQHDDPAEAAMYAAIGDRIATNPTGY